MVNWCFAYFSGVTILINLLNIYNIYIYHRISECSPGFPCFPRKVPSFLLRVVSPMARVRRQIFERIDKDGTGQLTLEDLVAGWETMGN